MNRTSRTSRSYGPPTRPSPPCMVGARIRLVAMAPDPCPIPTGATGTVRSVVYLGGMGGHQVSVDWDPPNETRTLSLIHPEDSFSVIKP